MTRDRVGYRASRKFALGAQTVERSMGITALCSDGLASGADAASTRLMNDGVASSPHTRLETRPVALMKWAFDDLVVEEQLPQAALREARLLSDMNGGGATARGGLLVRVVSEGVPDELIARLLRQRCRGGGTSLRFLSPVDFVTRASRYVWITTADAATRRQFSAPHLLRTPAGEVQLEAALHLPCESYPLHWLPDMRYTVVLRNVTEGTLVQLLHGLRGLAANGFLNYTHLARHGVGTVRAFEDAKCILRRDYVPVLQHHAMSLAEGTTRVRQEMPVLLDLLADARATEAEWKGVVQGMEYAVKADGAVLGRGQTGLYAPHHVLLLDFVRRAAELSGRQSRRHDSAQLMREAVSRLVLQEKMHSLAEVYFNALASLRWRRHGGRVVEGDVVLVDDAHGDGGAGTTTQTRADVARERVFACRGDVFEGAADHVNGELTSEHHVEWTALHEDQLVETLQPRLRLVRSEAEAASYDVTQVMLPFYGRRVDALPVLPTYVGRGGAAAPTLWHRLAAELEIEGMGEMRTAPRASYRRLVSTARDVGFYLCDEQRGWEWVEGRAGAALKGQLVKDQEGILRLRPPSAVPSRHIMLARHGIRGEERRGFFRKPAQRGGMLCAIQLTLPRGTPVTSALREVFQLTTLSPAAIFRLLA